MVKLRFKVGTVVQQLDTALLPGLISFCTIAEEVGGVTELTVTSVNDGKHKSGSLHYEGRALDIRCKFWPSAVTGAIVKKFKDFYDADFDLVWESPGQPNEHLHLEYDPGNKNHGA